MGKLTAARLKSLTEPGRYSEGDGLFLEVKPGGGRSLVLRAQCGGKRRDIGLGSLKSVDLGDAREAAHQIRRQIAGLDAIAQVIPSFREAAKIVHREHKASWKVTVRFAASQGEMIRSFSSGLTASRDALRTWAS